MIHVAVIPNPVPMSMVVMVVVTMTVMSVVTVSVMTMMMSAVAPAGMMAWWTCFGGSARCEQGGSNDGCSQNGECFHG